MARTEEEKVGGYITVRFGDEARRLPTLKIADSRTWKKLWADRFGADFDAMLSQPGEMSRLQALDTHGTTTLLELIVAYDKGKVLNGRKAIEASLDDEAILALYNSLVEVSFPFALGMLAAKVLITPTSIPAVPLDGASSPNSLSPNGASGLTVSPPN